MNKVDEKAKIERRNSLLNPIQKWRKRVMNY
jgi:hypothetical protein